MIKCLSTFLFFCFAISVLSQNFEGKITDSDHKIVYGSTVFIKETSQGLACNQNGEFQVTLPVGRYTVEYRCLGYEKVTEAINIVAGEKTVRNIVLKEKPIELKEVSVVNKEDPAYEIIRNAIRKASYNQNRLQEYTAESYIKGNMELTKVNALIDKLSSADGLKMSDYKDKLFVQESYSTIHYEAPDIYKQTVNAFSSSIPDNFDSKDVMQLSTSSLYLPFFAGRISPLNPKAFSYYRFRYEGFSEENGSVINKIKVIPKLNDPELLEGYIYLADNTWDIRQAELICNTYYGLQQDFTITYNNIGNDIYMPTTYVSKVEGNIMGVSGYFNYYMSVKYVDFKSEAKLKPKVITSFKVLEDKYKPKIKLETDSLASKRDSAYWMQIRTVPLSIKEETSFVKKDSVQQRINSLRSKYNNRKFDPSDLVMGGHFGGDSVRFTFKYGGVLGALRDYNFVDGFGLGQKIELSAKIGQENKIALTPEVYYTTARKKMVWKSDLVFKYRRSNEYKISAGNISSEFNHLGPNRLDNGISSLLWGRNASMFYNQKYLMAESYNYMNYLIRGLRLATQFKIASRDPLTNNTSYTIFGGKKHIKPNLFDPEYPDLLSYGIAIAYDGINHDQIDSRQGAPVYYSTLAFTLAYFEGLAAGKADNSRFRKLEGRVFHSIKTDYFSRLSYEVGGGSFLGDNSKMNFADYKFFSTVGGVWLTTKSIDALFTKPFVLLDAQTATNDYWAYSHVTYKSKYIALKRLPFLQGKMFNEVVHLKYLYMPQMKNYVETGYSIDFFGSLSFGVYASFNNFKYDKLGVCFSFNTAIFN